MEQTDVSIFSYFSNKTIIKLLQSVTYTSELRTFKTFNLLELPM